MAKIFGYRSIVATSTGEIAQMRNVGGPNVSFGDVDTTTMDSSSNYRTFAPALGDPGELTIAMLYDPAGASHKILASAAQSRTTKVWTVYHGSSTGDTDVFSGYVKGINRVIPMDDMIQADVTIKVTGKPAYST